MPLHKIFEDAERRMTENGYDPYLESDPPPIEESVDALTLSEVEVDTTVLVELEPFEYEHANSVGIRRFTENWGRADAAHYDRSRMQDDRTAQVAACVAELAVAKYVNEYWGGHAWPERLHSLYKEVPDVGRNIEVRRVRGDNPPAIRHYQRGKGLVLFAVRVVEPELRSAEILGWIDHDEGWESRRKSQWGHTVPVDVLYAPMDYFDRKKS